MRPLLAAALACAGLAASASAAADPSVDDVRAHQAYERGTAAFRRGDYGTAAREYAAADALAPNPTALQAALDATVQADDPVLGEKLLDRARGAPRSNALTATMLVAEQKFAHRTGRIAFECRAQPCVATVDGAAADPSQPAVVRVGAHTVTIEAGGPPVRQSVDVAADASVAVASAPANAGSAAASAAEPTASPSPVSGPDTPPDASPKPAPSPGLSPAWFFAGLGATAVATGVAVGLGVDTASKHSAFDRACRSATPAADCSDLASNGQSAQTRTNVMVAVAAGLGAATLATLFFVRWHGARASVGLTSASVAVDF